MKEMKDRKYEVCVRCMTFNHSSFIEETLNGFTMQQTDFPYVCCIVDDASNDDNPEKIRIYMNRYFDMDVKDCVRREETDDYIFCFAQHKTNKNCFFAVYYLKYNHYRIKKSKMPYQSEWFKSSRYTATCEGDDYWVLPNKIQKQVDYFKSHPGVGLVYTAYRLQNDVTGINKDVFTSPAIKHNDTFKWRLLEQTVMIGTCTVMIDVQLWETIKGIKDDYEGYLMGDTQTFFNAARLSGVGYIPEVTGVYRKQPSGATATFDESRRVTFIRSCLDMHLHLAYKYGAPKETIWRIKSTYGFYCFRLYMGSMDYDKASQLNSDYFDNNQFINVIIKVSEKLRIKRHYGLGTILRISASLGLINMK